MQKFFLVACAVIAMTGQPCYSQQVPLKPPVKVPTPTPPPPPPPPQKPVIADNHKRLKAIYRAPIFMVRHPVLTFHRLTYPVQHPLQTGKWMEKSGFNGLLGGLGAAGNIGTTVIVGAKKSI